MRIISSMLITLAWCWLVPAAWAGQAGQADLREAMALTEQGARFLRQHGSRELIRRINARDPLFNRGALYLAMRDLKGITLAHPSTSLIGKNLLDVPDADGKLFRHEMVAIANGSGRGWVAYKFTNPATGRVQDKTTYVLRSGDVALEAGVYLSVAQH